MASMESITVKNYISKHKHIVTFIISGLMTCFLLCIAFYTTGITPFGSKRYSLTVMDAWLQYIDYFAYYKDVLTGHNSIAYSFSKGLGGGGIAFFTYYLTSPINLLLLFFKKTQILVFFNIAVLIKLTIAAITASIFLRYRFTKLSSIYVVLLSVCYALSQYSLQQASNIMWLDGVYMLPLILLGVYKLVKEQRSLLLIITTALSIIFNWYTGLLNGMFLCLWFIAELALSDSDSKNTFAYYRKTITRFVLSGICVIFLSSFVLIPTLLELRGERGKIDKLSGKGFIGSPLSEITGYIVGKPSTFGQASLYAASIVLIAVLGFFVCKIITTKEKLVWGSLLALMLISFHSFDLYFVFSLLKSATSYYYRYAYLVIAVLITIAAQFIERADWCSTKSDTTFDAASWKRPLIIAVVLYLVLLAALNYATPSNSMWYTILSVIVSTAIVISIANPVSDKTKKQFMSVLLVCVVSLDLLANATLTIKRYRIETTEFDTYVPSRMEQLQNLQSLDHGYYRINQTAYRHNDPKSYLPTTFNEGLAYNYMPLAVYTSDPDPSTRNILDNVGYNKNGDNFNVIAISNLAADSLLGAKYVFSKYKISGLEKVKEISTVNNISVYKNPFALPLAYSVDSRVADIPVTGNPFEYVNRLYSEYIGEKVEVFKPAKVSRTIEKNKVTYVTNAPQGMPVYGRIDGLPSSTLHINSVKMGYAQWDAPTVFDIPSGMVSITTNDSTMPKPEHELFYYIDLNELSKVHQILSTSGVEINKWDNNGIDLSTSTDTPKTLATTIPFDTHWKVTVNGKTVQTKDINNFLMIDIPEGKSAIRMHFTLAGMTESSILSTIALVCLIAVGIYRKKNNPLRK